MSRSPLAEKNMNPNCKLFLFHDKIAVQQLGASSHDFPKAPLSEQSTEDVGYNFHGSVLSTVPFFFVSFFSSRYDLPFMFIT